MNPKTLTSFTSEKSFWLSEIRAGDLLLSNPGGIHNPTTTDIIFRAVLYLEVPFLLDGIHLHQPCDEKALTLEQKFGKHRCVADDYRGDLVYAIESRGERYHVVASNAWVHIHTLPSELSPLYFIGEAGLEEEMNYFNTYVKEYYKIGR